LTTKTVDAGEARLSELLSLVRAGHEVTISEGGTPLARLVPVGGAGAPRVAGLNEGLVRMREDFDEPLPEGFWTGHA
jgi:prevent-host-death family protein